MQKTRAKTIKGLGIGCIVLSALCLAAYVIAIVALSACVVYYDPIVDALQSGVSMGSFDIYAHHGYDYSFNYGSPYYDYGYVNDIMESEILLFVIQFGMILMVLGFVLQAFSLVAAIIITINSDKPKKYNLAFGWGIAGAIVSLLSGGFIQTVLFVLAAVFIYGDRKLYQSGRYPMVDGAQPVMVAAQQPTVVAAQPSVPVSQPAPSERHVVNEEQPVVPAENFASEEPPAILSVSETDDQSKETIHVAQDLIEPDKVEEDTVVETEILTSDDNVDPSSFDEKQQ